jgi:uncharacterized protein (TIGR03085 family)
MSRFASRERQNLCDTFEQVGPDAPTLCSPWLTRDLAAHLVVRERRPDVAAGIWLPAMTGRLEKVQNGYAAWDWPRLVHEVRSGPPSWSPTSIGRVDEAINTAEFFIHHEDVLRGGPEWTARELPGDLESALWRIVSRVAKMQLALVWRAPGPCRHGRRLSRDHRHPRRAAPLLVRAQRRGPGRRIRLRRVPGRRLSANLATVRPVTPQT